MIQTQKMASEVYLLFSHIEVKTDQDQFYSH